MPPPSPPSLVPPQPSACLALPAWTSPRPDPQGDAPANVAAEEPDTGTDPVDREPEELGVRTKDPGGQPDKFGNDLGLRPGDLKVDASGREHVIGSSRTVGDNRPVESSKTIGNSGIVENTRTLDLPALLIPSRAGTDSAKDTTLADEESLASGSSSCCCCSCCFAWRSWRSWSSWSNSEPEFQKLRQGAPNMGTTPRGVASPELLSPSSAAAQAAGCSPCSVPNSMPRALSLIFAWYIFSMGLSLYNKFLVGEQHGHFPAPLLMTTFHFLLQCLLSNFLIHCVCTSWAPSTPISCRDYNLRIVPTAMATALDIGLSNLSLAFISLTFYTMCKSSAPVFLLLFAFLFRLEAMSIRLLCVMVVISIGVLCTVFGETHFQFLGFVLVMGSAITSGLRWVLIQVLLQKEKLGLTNPLVTLAYLTPVMALLCAVFSLLHEPWHKLHTSPFFDTWPHAMYSLVIMVLGGLLAFFMILTEFLLVLETSAVTFSVAGTVKEGATILVSHFVFGDPFTRVNLFGIFVILLGVSLFNMYRHGRSPPTPKEAKLFQPGAPEDLGPDDRQRLLSPRLEAHSGEMQLAVAQAPVASSGHDPALVLLASSVEQVQQQRTMCPALSSPSSPTLRHVDNQRLLEKNAKHEETLVESHQE